MDEEKKPEDFVMPFGKYHGYTLAEIRDRDEQYLIWAAENLSSHNIRMKCKEALAPF